MNLSCNCNFSLALLLCFCYRCDTVLMTGAQCKIYDVCSDQCAELFTARVQLETGTDHVLRFHGENSTHSSTTALASFAVLPTISPF